MVREEVARREKEERISKQKERVSAALAELNPSFEALTKHPLDRGYAKDAENAAEDLQDVLNDGRELEKTSPDYANFAKDKWALLEKRAASLRISQALIRFYEGPVAKATEARPRAVGESQEGTRQRNVATIIRTLVRASWNANWTAARCWRRRRVWTRQLFTDGSAKQTPTSVVKSCASLSTSTAKLVTARKKK